jgi:hypoxanthine phosphoribosyltransferase
MRDVELSGFSRREVFFTKPPILQDRDILIIASMLHTGVTLDFLCKRLQENRPRSLRIAVLLDKPADRRVDLQPDYFGFLGASNRFVGYGLAGAHEHYRNLPFVGAIGGKGPAGNDGKKSGRASSTTRLKRGKS